MTDWDGNIFTLVLFLIVLITFFSSPLFLLIYVLTANKKHKKSRLDIEKEIESINEPTIK